MYYISGEITDYIYGLVSLIFVIFITIYFWKFKKNKPILQYTDREYLRTLGIVELRWLNLSAEDSTVIDEIIEEKKKKRL